MTRAKSLFFFCSELSVKKKTFAGWEIIASQACNYGHLCFHTKHSHLIHCVAVKVKWSNFTFISACLPEFYYVLIRGLTCSTDMSRPSFLLAQVPCVWDSLQLGLGSVSLSLSDANTRRYTQLKPANFLPEQYLPASGMCLCV